MGFPSDPRGPGKGEVAPWSVLEKEPVFRCPIFSLVAKTCRHPERRKEAKFYVLEANDWVNVVALTADAKMVLVNQYRYGTEETSWEIPGGVMDEGEDPVEAGLRELREETGYTAERALLLGSARPNPAIQNNHCHFVLATGARETDGTQWDEHEDLVHGLFEVDEVFRMALEGGITHALALNGLMLFWPRWEIMKRRRRQPADTEEEKGAGPEAPG